MNNIEYITTLFSLCTPCRRVGVGGESTPFLCFYTSQHSASYLVR